MPKATLEIPGGERRLDRILSLIGSCRYSFHDLSRVELDERPPPTPRFNMPFELGLAVAWARRRNRNHTWFVLESAPYRVQKSLSDLGGTDVYIHDGRPEGVFRQLVRQRPGQRSQATDRRADGRGLPEAPGSAARDLAAIGGHLRF